MTDLQITCGNSSAATWYEPVPNSCFIQLMQSLHISFEQYTFIDYGSGKGRVLFLASTFPLQRIIGVEFSHELNAIAQKNITTYQNPNKRCSQIESICTDATEFVLPCEPSILFFYSPFNASILSCVLKRIRDSLIWHPRDLYILFVGVMPDLIDVLMRSGMGFREVRLRRDHVRGESKRGFISHHAAAPSRAVR